jgi:hypothetical protein
MNIESSFLYHNFEKQTRLRNNVTCDEFKTYLSNDEFKTYLSNVT